MPLKFNNQSTNFFFTSNLSKLTEGSVLLTLEIEPLAKDFKFRNFQKADIEKLVQVSHQ